MKKAAMEKWVAALESGKYKQGDGRLFNPNTNSYCCLGVLCKINKVTCWNYGTLSIAFHKFKKKIGWDKDNPYGHFKMTDEITKMIGNKDKVTNSLAILNDNEVSFKTIAKIIRKIYKEL